jgi:hypothetical protein
MSLISQKYGFGILDPEQKSGIWKNPILDPVSRIHNTAFFGLKTVINVF